MPELMLLAVVSLTAMALLVFLFLKLNQAQTSLIESLTLTNQSLLNQVRSKDITTLAGLQHATGTAPVADESETYMSTDAREIAAFLESVKGQPLGDTIYDEDLDILRNG